MGQVPYGREGEKIMKQKPPTKTTGCEHKKEKPMMSKEIKEHLEYMERSRKLTEQRIRASERKRIVDEMVEWIYNKIIIIDFCGTDTDVIDAEQLKYKLNSLTPPPDAKEGLLKQTKPHESKDSQGDENNNSNYPAKKSKLSNVKKGGI